tara:strand:- start:55 stop:189 length:135 start_codon:yes stop_codon:yes gene_type:complete
MYVQSSVDLRKTKDAAAAGGEGEKISSFLSLETGWLWHQFLSAD